MINNVVIGGTKTTKQTSVTKSAAVSMILIAILIFVYNAQIVIKKPTATPIAA